MYSRTPVLQDSFIYTNNCVSSLYALKESDLSTMWTVTDFGFIPMPVADERYVYATDRSVLRALAKSDGHTVWYAPIVGKNSANPVISADTIYFVTWQLFADGFLYAIDKTNDSILYQRKILTIKADRKKGLRSRCGNMERADFRGWFQQNLLLLQ